MNPEKFDNLTKVLASTISRRDALKYLGGSLAGGLLTALGINRGIAKDAVSTSLLQKEDTLSFPGKLNDWYATGKELFDKLNDYMSNLQTCLERGFSADICNRAYLWCQIMDALIAEVYPGWVSQFQIFGAFKTDCGNGECFQCCHVPQSSYGCHTSFIGFPVLNCNENYGAGTRPAGITLIVDPDAQPGDACLFTGQTCEHIAICTDEYNDAYGRSVLPPVANEWLTDPRAVSQRARTFADYLQTAWIDYLKNYTTSDSGALPLFTLATSITGRGRSNWKSDMLTTSIDWESELFRVTDNQGQVIESASRFNAIQQLGLLRLLAGIPNLEERLAFVESQVWLPDEKEVYLAQIDDPDNTLLQFMSPHALNVLKQVPSLQDYRLLAVPLPSESSSSHLYGGIELGQPPELKVLFVPTEDGVSIQVTIINPETMPTHSQWPLAVDWGDGQVTKYLFPTAQNTLQVSHSYLKTGKYLVYVMTENNTGLRGFAAVVAEPSQATTQPPATTMPTIAEFLFADIEFGEVGYRHGLSLEFWLVDDLDDRYRIGRSTYAENQQTQPSAFSMGSVITHNVTRVSVSRIIIELQNTVAFNPTLQAFVTYFTLSELVCYVFSTASGEMVPHLITLTPTMLRVYLEGNDVPLPTDDLVVDENGRIQVPALRRISNFGTVEYTDRVEIDILPSFLAGFSLEGTDIDYPVGQSWSWSEAQPGFVTSDQTLYLPIVRKNYTK